MSQTIKAGIALIMLGLILVVPISTAVAQEPTADVLMQITPALGGHVKYGEWLPLHVQLTNNGGDVEAEIQANIHGSNGQVIYAAPAHLPSGARKEIVLYIQPPSFIKTATVRLVSGDQILVEAEVDLTAHPRSHYLIGVLTNSPDAFSSLNGMALTGRDQVHTIPLALTTFPQRAEPLRSLDAIILAGVDTSPLAPAQADALRMWVERGGRLLIGGGVGAQRTLVGLPEALRPVAPGEILDVTTLQSLSEFTGDPIQVPGPFPVAAPAQVHGRVLIEEEEIPLLVQDYLSEGWIGYLALDPTASPFDAWVGALAFWKRLLEPGAALDINLPQDIPERVLESEQMGYALTNLPSLELPSVRWLILLLGLYIVLVGPINFLVLRRLQRPSLAWITIPVLTLLFSVGSFGLGYSLRGRDAIIHQITILPLYESSATTPANTVARAYVGIFSPSRRDYNLSVSGDALIGPLFQANVQPWSSREPWSGDVTTQLNVLQGNPSIVRGMAVNQWAMQSFQAEKRLTPADEFLDTDLILGTESVRGTIHNHLDAPLQNVIVLLGNRFAHLGDVPASEAVEVDIPFEITRSGAPFPWSLFENEQAMGIDRSSREAQLRQTILQAVFHTNWGPPKAPITPMLMAWTDVNVLNVEIEQVRASRQATTFIVQRLSLPVEAGHVTLPPGILSGNLLTSEGEAGTCGPAGQVYLADGEVTLAYQLPPNLQGIQPTRLTLQASSDGGAWETSPDVALYDWGENAWVQLEPFEPDTVQVIATPERFVDQAGGGLHLRAGYADRAGGKCYQFDVGLEGEMDTGTEETDHE